MGSEMCIRDRLYRARNEKITTHSVWRSLDGTIEDDCPSMGYGLPYDTSLTNPYVGIEVKTSGQGANPAVAIGQPEPNGIHASTNTSATWVFCVNPDNGGLDPIYVETKVTAYPMSIRVDYPNNRVYREGKSNYTIQFKGNN